MSDSGKYTFLPWLRQGISTQIGEADGTPVTGHADVKVRVSISGGPESSPIDVVVNVLGPGDVKGLDTRAITRHWPRPDVFEVEPNYFPLIELFPADVAWRYTPAKADSQDRLRPWLGLIVLRDDEIDKLEGPTTTLPITKLTTKTGAPLPRIDQLWAWAHVHVDGVDASNPVEIPVLQGILDNASHRVVARLVCPRRLDSLTVYTAFLVPTLEAARLSVLGQTVDSTFDISQPAWKNDGTAVQLPVFYSWRFQTSDTGDFESLVKRIVSQPLPATVGERPMDVSDPGLGLGQAASTPLAVESALRALDSQSTPWDPNERQTWTTALAGFLNLPDLRLQQAGASRVLVPPLYGRWYAAIGRLDPTAQPPWFQDLNADPRTRVAAALGWQVVQNEQQQLLAGAWAQVDAVRAANTELRNAQLAREASFRLYQRHVLALSQPVLMSFTAPLHARLLLKVATTPLTVRGFVIQSPLTVGVLEPAFIRLSRPLGPVGIRQGRAFQTTPTLLLDRLNTGQLVVAPPPPTAPTMVTPANAGTEIAPVWLTPELADWLAKVPNAIWFVIEELLALVLKVWPKFLDPPLRAELEEFLQEVQQALKDGDNVGDNLKRRIAVRDGKLTPEIIKAAPAQPGFVARALNPDGTLPPRVASTAPEDTRFRDAAAQAFGDVNAAPAPGVTLYPLDITLTINSLAAAIDPTVTVPATFKLRLSPPPSWVPQDTMDQVMASPSFSQPLYKPLFDISPDWILSGLGDLPQNVVSLARPNERFIESYMLGANDEVGRTLLFNEYPTDQRGNYFQQFFDTNGVPNPQVDINAITQWPKTSALGSNAARPNVDNLLVLIVRAELLHRYPNTLVYAVKAVWNGTSRAASTDPADTLQPEFLGTLGIGAGFWGFQLSTADAIGSDSPSGPAGWYFVLQEHSSEPRFGLEPVGTSYGTSPTSWQALAWSDLAADAASLAKVDYIDLGATLPNVGSVVDPSHAKWHVSDGARASDLAYVTYRQPVRLLVHASKMIPPGA
jgi:hypothetical protein